MTRRIDPTGNAVVIGYDASFRVTAITDSLGQVTTISYERADDPLKITKVTDPFGRFAVFDYAAGKLSTITDVIGIQSQFTYLAGTDSIDSLTTPYGTTTFVTGENGANRWIEMTDPLGGRSGWNIGTRRLALAPPIRSYRLLPVSPISLSISRIPSIGIKKRCWSPRATIRRPRSTNWL